MEHMRNKFSGEQQQFNSREKPSFLESNRCSGAPKKKEGRCSSVWAFTCWATSPLIPDSCHAASPSFPSAVRVVGEPLSS